MKHLWICLCLLIASTLTWTVYASSIPPDEVESALLARNWTPYNAHAFAAVPADTADLTNLEGSRNAKAYTTEACPITHSHVYIEQTVSSFQRPDYIEHEMHHLADYSKQGCRYDTETTQRDFFSLHGYQVVESYRTNPQRDNPDVIIHFNHDLIVSLNWNINSLPQWYIDKYFWYMQPPAFVEPTPLPTATPTPVKTKTPVSVTRYTRIYIPRVDLKIAS